MSENEGAMIALKPKSASAQTACSRDEPEPKLAPATRTGFGSSVISPSRNQS